MRVYEAIVKGLEGIGVKTAFGGAGESVADLMLALEESRGIRTVIARNEQAASFMACGEAMYTDRLGFCFATAGPGAFNLISGLSVAMTDSYPVLAVSGYARMEWEGWGALNETSGVHRTPDSRTMFAATTKKSFLISDPSDTCDLLEEAVNTALRGRPGPVHLHVASDLNERGTEVKNFRSLRLDVARVLPDPARVEEIASVLADKLRQHRRIVLLAGYGAVRSGAGPEIRRLIERFQIPLVTTLDGKGIVSEAHPLAVGVFADSGHSSAWKAFREADVVLAVGNSFNQHATFDFRGDLFEDKLLIHVNIDGGEFEKRYRADHTLLSDARPAVAALVDALERRVSEVPRAEVDGQDYEARRIVRLPGKLHPGQLAQAIGRMLPPQGILLGDAGAHTAWLGYYVELEDGQHFRKAGSFGPMAGAVNSAIGVQLAHPGRTVVVGCGDGCYAMSGFELMTAVEHEIPVIWVIFNDEEFKLIKLYQLSQHGESALTGFRNPDYAAYARACGADGHRVETLDEFEDAFRRALSSGRPTLIDAHITRWAVPHYSPSPDGVIAGLVEAAEERYRED
ncbi:thiamine pyrophosphate-binding protein [Streptomyces sp. NPDC020707]|uniref:Thiamine pyrophosphate-binding protein n=1 Tax=Streptomyces ortus TaxID=2867268 RepID=A0ABT3VFK0_9ACTN|nr:thiamine pyrophosphate-binding protein [Streptomyces ortus]MCX4238676.1 thiamine pyrophosphate-binding protein [Streptomyces ortus]